MTLRRNFVVCCLIFVAPAVNSNTLPEPGDNWDRAILAAHNQIRARVEVRPLRWSPQLAEHAEEWASRLLHERQFYHRPHPVFGENLFEITGARASAAQVIEVWASEASDYSYHDNTCRAVCGHYTQLIWSDTREVGCAVARDASREVWVCNYNPPGNWIGERPY